MIYLLSQNDEIDAIAPLIDEALHHIEPLIESVFTVAIDAYSQAGRVDSALQVCRCCLRISLRLTLASQWLETMKKHGLAPRSRTYCPVRLLFVVIECLM